MRHFYPIYRVHAFYGGVEDNFDKQKPRIQKAQAIQTEAKFFKLTLASFVSVTRGHANVHRL